MSEIEAQNNILESLAVVIDTLPDYDDQGWNELDNAKCDVNYAKEQLIKIASHYFSSGDDFGGDTCSVCGRNIRNVIHKRTKI